MGLHPRTRAMVAATALAVTTSACAGAGGSGGGGGGGGEGGGGEAVSVIMVNNPQMVDLQALTEEHFTAETGIEVDFTVLPENDVRDRIAQEFATQAGTYDVASISNYEVPFFVENGWLEPLGEYIAEDEEFNADDILEPIAAGLTVDDDLYALPFYGESSFLMYRTDVFEEAGLTMPENPTWEQVAELAAQLDGARPGMAGICLRGLPGWGQVFAPLATVVNTFGGTWWDEEWNSQVTSPEFVEATQFYVDTVREHGETGAAQAGFTECLNNMTQGNVAMWYDATSAAGSLEAEGSPVAGKIGYVQAPVKETESSGWLYSWAWGMQEASDNKQAAWDFMSWASSQEYEELVGAELGWAQVPAGKRASLYENPAYQEAAAPFYEATQEAITSANPEDPGVQPRPAAGIQFVAIPEFADVATRCSQFVTAAIAGQTTVEQALQDCEPIAQQVTEKYQSE